MPPAILAQAVNPETGSSSGPTRGALARKLFRLPRGLLCRIRVVEKLTVGVEDERYLLSGATARSGRPHHLP